MLKVHATAQPDYPSHHYKAWQLLWNNRASGKLGIGLTPAYLDEGFIEVFYQLDFFMAAFALYGGESWQAMASLEDFYTEPRSNGYKHRVHSEKDSKPSKCFHLRT